MKQRSKKNENKMAAKKRTGTKKNGSSFPLLSGLLVVLFGAVLFLVVLTIKQYIAPMEYTSPNADLPQENAQGDEQIQSGSDPQEKGSLEDEKEKAKVSLDKTQYDRLMQVVANCPEIEPTIPYTLEATKEMKGYECIWPAEGNPYPLPGALLPYNRIVAYYGNFYSKQMGILGEYKADVVLKKLKAQIDKWEKADPNTPVIPAIDYIAVTAQASAGPDGNYNLRMPDDQIEHAIEMAKQVNGIVVLELQVGYADLLKEAKMLEKFLKKPIVHLAIDPEFHMRRGNPPGTWIGTVKASDVNAVIEYLTTLVKENDIPPKILLVHAFTNKMIQNEELIKPTRAVQVVIVMDGWGPKHLKRSTWRRVLQPNPVQFTGFKIFYENDTWEPSTGIMTPEEVLDLRPKPVYIQYQ